MTNYDLLPQEWKDRVDALVSLKRNKNKYDSKEVYAIHNYIFNLNEATSTCGSCLNRRYKEIDAWLQASVKDEDKETIVEEPKVAETAPNEPKNEDVPTVEETGMDELSALSERLGFDVKPFVDEVKANGFFLLTTDARKNKILRNARIEIHEIAKHLEG